MGESQPGKEQTLDGIFRWIEAEIDMLKAIPKIDPMNFQRVVDEAKKMITDANTQLKDDCEDRFAHVGLAVQQLISDSNKQLKDDYKGRFTQFSLAVQQEHAYTEGRLDDLDKSVAGLRASGACAGTHSAPLRQPPQMASRGFCGAYSAARVPAECQDCCPPGISGAEQPHEGPGHGGSGGFQDFGGFGRAQQSS